MHIQTHVMSGWVVGNYCGLTARERFFCMLAASLPDLDGIGMIFGMESDAYLNWHHILGHNIFFGLLCSVVLTALSSRSRIKCFIIYLALFHLHMIMDFFGSGELWTISYLYPVSKHEFSTEFCWPLFSWQNLLAGFLLLVWCIVIAIRNQRFMLEFIMPKLDAKICIFLTKVFRFLIKEPKS